MGRGPLEVVAPSVWKTRTSKFGRRSGSIVEIDELYRIWHGEHTVHGRNASPVITKSLADALHNYLVKHGKGDWTKVPRNNESGGLMAYIYDQVKEHRTRAEGPSLDLRAQRAINTIDVPHSRYGVLYLLGNVKIDMNRWSIGLEGVGAVGGALASGFGTNYSHLDNKEKAEIKVGGDWFMKDSSIGDMGEMGGVPFSIASGATNRTGTKMPTGDRFETVRGDRRGLDGKGVVIGMREVQAPPKRELPGFPVTGAVLEGIAEDPLLFLNPYTLAGTAVVLTGSALVEAFNNLRVIIINAVTDLWEYIKRKMLQNSEWAWEVSGTVVSKAIKFIVAKCLESAAPLIGGIMDLGGGIIKTIKAAKERLESWWDRRKISLVPGHPTELADAIESNMSKGIFQGLYSILKGVASVSLAVLLPGAQSLVSALVTGIEWLVKLVWRIWEQSKINKFLTLAREHYANERSLALANSIGERNNRPGGQTIIPDMNPDHGGIIHDLYEFTNFFKKGCDASPIIPMLTLNTGICGSLMTMARMFNDVEEMITQEKFDTADSYFTRLKQHGRDYMRQCGFEFLPYAPDDRAIAGLLNHALQHHTGDHSMVDRALAFGSSFAS